MRRAFRSIILGLTVGLVALGGVMGVNYTGNANKPAIAVKDVQPLATQGWLQAVCDDEKVATQNDVAEVVMRAQEEAEVGELVRLDLTGSVAQSIKWLMVPATVDFEAYNNGKNAHFSARKAGSYMFIVACAYEGTVDVVIHTVVVTGATAPDGATYPEIVLPQVDAPMNEWVMYWCAANRRPKEEAKRLAASFENVATQIAAGVIQDPSEIIAATATANRAALGDSLTSWMPVLEQLQARMKEQADAGNLTTADEHRATWLMISKGLREYVALFK
jgi:hypothetical protein